MHDGTMATAVRLSAAVEALGALAAFIRVETEGLEIDPRVRDLLEAVVDELLGQPAADVSVQTPIVGMARALLRQAADLIDNPERTGPWAQVDEALLEGLGRLSMAITGAFAAAEDTLDGLGERLRGPGAAFLEVGTGTGWLAIATARHYPATKVVGIDLFEPALTIARRNVAQSGLGDRVELRLEDVVALADVAAYDAVWLPMPFLPAEIVPAALSATKSALRSGGWLLAGTFAGSDDRLSQLLIELRTVRSGGEPWHGAALIAALEAHGFEDVVEVPRTWTAPVKLYCGRQP